MKQIPSLALKTGLQLAVFPLGLLLCPTLPAAVTFTITPAAVSNTYNGAITLQVNGLTNTEAVVVQKFLDLNTNGVIDASDWLVQQVKLTDGQPGMVIGGVTNFNVPGDIDPAAGQVTAKLKFRNGDFIQNIAGQYAFRLSSPSGNFAPITNLFSVTNVPYGQQFTGNVVSNGTSTTLPNTVVLLFPPSRPGKDGPGGSPLAGTVADNSGSYTLPAPPGTYMLVAFSGNYLADFSTPPVLVLGSAATVTTNLMLASATSTISGSVVDANNSSKGLPGIFLTIGATNGLMGVGFTDTSGNFTLGVQSSPAQWRLQAEGMSLIVHGYVGLQNKTDANAGQTGVTVGVPKATALFYGSVMDNLGNPMPGIDVNANDNNNYLYQSDGLADANGNYVVGALGGLSNDPWGIQISGDMSPTNYLFSRPAYDSNGGTNIGVGQAVLQNFTAILATNHISGWLKDDSGNPIAGVGVWANTTIGGADYNQGTVDTDTNGNYRLNVANGTWSVGVSGGGGDDSLPGNYLSLANQLVVITNNNGTVNFTALSATNQITGHVQQSNGNPIGYVGVWASATINTVDYFQFVDADGSGNYLLNVANGSWTVGLETSGGSDSLDAILGNGNYQFPTNQNVFINNSNGTANFAVQPCGGVQIVTTNLPDGQVGFFYDQFLQGSSCSGQLNWSLNDPQNFPSSLGWSGNGEIQGTPNSSGTFNFSVHLDDGNGHSTNQSLSLYIAPVSSPLQVTTTFLPNGTNGAFYNQSLGATGGQPPYHWLLSPFSASLPPSLVLATNGLISGIPGSNGTFFFSVRAIDSTSATADQSLSVTIGTTPLQVVTATLPDAAQNGFYSTALVAAGGQPPYRWSLAPGSASLPYYLALGTNGVISGTPASSETDYFIVRVTDSASTTADHLLALVVSGSTNKPVVILSRPTWLANGHFQFTFNTAPGASYTLEVSSDLRNWAPVSILSGSGGPLTVSDLTASDSRRFYRISIEQ